MSLIALRRRLRGDDDQRGHRCTRATPPRLVRFATVLIGPSDADDLVADTVLRVFSHPGWSQVKNQRADLYRAVLNQAHQEARSSAA